VVASEQSPGKSASDGTYLYFGHVANGANQLLRAPVGGSTATALLPSTDVVQAVAVDSVHVFVAGQSSIQLAPIGGGTVSTLATTSRELHDIVIDAHAMYWLETEPSQSCDGIPATIWKLPYGSTNPTVLASAGTCGTHLVLGGGQLYWIAYDFPSETHQLMTLSTSGGTPTTLDTAKDGIGIAADAAHVYWSGTENGSAFIRRVASDGSGKLAVFRTSTATVTDLAVDGGALYWSEPYRAELYRSGL
jgi:hypothetical protein